MFVARPDEEGRYGAVVSAVEAGLVTGDDATVVGVHAADVDDDGLEDLVVTSGPHVDRPRAVTTYVQGRVPGGAGLAAGEGL